MLLDAHAHLDFYPEAELPAVLGMIREQGILTVADSVSMASWEKTRHIAARCDRVIPSFGLHPVWGDAKLPPLSQLERAVAEALLIGEIGLDYSRATTAQRRSQRERFECLLHLAREADKAVAIHSKVAEREVLACLDRVGPLRTLVHWYQGPADVARELLERGAYFSIGFAVLDTEPVRERVRHVPVDQLLTETDTPVARPLRGWPATPDRVGDVTREVARLEGMEAAPGRFSTRPQSSAPPPPPRAGRRWPRRPAPPATALHPAPPTARRPAAPGE